MLFSLDQPQINVSEVLVFDTAELYQTRNESGILISKGPLQVLYAKEYNWFVLKIGGFNYGLSPNIPVLASREAKGGLNYYVLPNSDGFYVIKLIGLYSQDDIQNLESVFRESADLAYQEGPEGHGLLVESAKGKVTIRRAPRAGHHSQRPEHFLAHLIYEGGKKLRSFMLNTAEVISHGISKVGDHVSENYLEGPVKAKPLERVKPQKTTSSGLAFLKELAMTVSQPSSDEFTTSMHITQKLGQKVEAELEKKKFQNELALMHDRVRNIGKKDEVDPKLPQAIAFSAVTVWNAMFESLDIIRAGITDTTSTIVSSKYGPAVGQAFRMGVTLAGNTMIPSKTLGIPGAGILMKLAKI